MSLIANVAHELRTPLTNIRGHLEALTDDVLPPSKEIFQSLQEETLLLANVVDSLFTLAAAAASAIRLGETYLATTVARAMTLCRRKLRPGISTWNTGGSRHRERLACTMRSGSCSRTLAKESQSRIYHSSSSDSFVAIVAEMATPKDRTRVTIVKEFVQRVAAV